MPLRDLLKKKDKIDKLGAHDGPPREAQDETPTFTFIRSDTYTEERIIPPTFSSEESSPAMNDGASDYLRAGLFKKERANSTSGASISSKGSQKSDKSEKTKSRPSNQKRLSERLHIRRSVSSSHVPLDLPDIHITDDGRGSGGGAESQWEERATILARENERQRSRPSSPGGVAAGVGRQLSAMTLGMDSSPGAISDKRKLSSKHGDDNIQEAIRLHEAGELAVSTQMFGRLADPKGENNALSQVLYGLALRHGWGCTPNPSEAVTYLSAAASNAASIENLALQAGMKKGGAAKGELVLAIFELANCFRHGWGVEKDAVAAQRYYETAANLGDTDAMNEVAWCYMEGFGCKKDRFAAARYYRLAEQHGNKTLGNTWIWKDKYNPPATYSSPPKKR